MCALTRFDYTPKTPAYKPKLTRFHFNIHRPCRHKTTFTSRYYKSCCIYIYVCVCVCVCAVVPKMGAKNGSDLNPKWTESHNMYPQRGTHSVKTRVKVSSSADIWVFSRSAGLSLTQATVEHVASLACELLPLPHTLHRHYFSPAWSRSGWLILLSPCSVIQIWKVNNKLTSLRLYTGVTHSSGYRTHGSMRARHISPSKNPQQWLSRLVLRRHCAACFKLSSHDV